MFPSLKLTIVFLFPWCRVRFFRCRPDVCSADTALWHARQLLPRQHDPTQGQPGRPHNPVAPPTFPRHLSHGTDWTSPTHLMGWRRQRPVIFLSLDCTSGSTVHLEQHLHHTDLLLSQAALQGGDAHKTHTNTHQQHCGIWKRGRCVCVFIFFLPQHTSSV